MKLRTVFIIVFSFVALHFLLSFLSTFIIPYLGFFPYKDVLMRYNSPQFIRSLANFDGVHYLLISKNGYAQYEQAFFPLYPLLIYLFEPLIPNNPLILGLLISNVSFFLGIFVFVQYLKTSEVFPLRSSTSEVNWVVFFLLLFPTSFFFISVYTEGLFFLLFVSSLYFLKKENYLLASLCAFLASITRLIGVFLIIPIGISVVKKMIGGTTGRVPDSAQRSEHWREGKSGQNLSFFKPLLQQLLLLFSPLLGFTTYVLYLWKTTGDPFFFLSSQPAFGAHRSAKLILLPQVYFRYIKIFLTAQPNFQYFVSLSEFVVFSSVFFVVILSAAKDLIPYVKQILRRRYASSQNDEMIGLHLFSITNLLLSTLTGTFSSIPRYALLSVSFFIALARIRNTVIKTTILAIFGLFHILIFGLFIQGYFVS